MARSGLDYRDSAWVAKELHLDVSTIEELMRDGELPGFQVGGKWLVSQAVLQEFLDLKEQAQRKRPDRTSFGAVRHVSGHHSGIARRIRKGRARYRLLGGPLIESSSKGMLVDVLTTLKERDQTFLDRFMQEGGRKRQYVATNPLQLYPDRPDLVKNAKESLGGGWWVGTNYSAKEIETILRKACRVAGLRWGQDFVLEGSDDAQRNQRALSMVGIGADPDPNASSRLDELFVEAALNE